MPETANDRTACAIREAAITASPGRLVSFLYPNSTGDGASLRVVEPYEIKDTSTGLRVVYGYDVAKDDHIRAYALERMSELAVGTSTFADRFEGK